MNSNPITQLEQLTVNTESKSYLKEIANWTFFFSILGFISIAFLLLIGIFSSFIIDTLPEAQTAQVPFDLGTILTVMYISFAVIYFLPMYYLMQFSTKMKKALVTKNDEMLAEALGVLKSHYKFIGVLTIIMISLYVLLIVASVFGALV